MDSFLIVSGAVSWCAAILAFAVYLFRKQRKRRIVLHESELGEYTRRSIIRETGVTYRQGALKVFLKDYNEHALDNKKTVTTYNTARMAINPNNDYKNTTLLLDMLSYCGEEVKVKGRAS